MMSEKWTIVDINENEVGLTWERGSNLKIPDGLFHVAVSIWIKDQHGNILLTQRHPDKSWGLKWECSGGSVLAGESVIEGVQRELREETGIILSEDKLKYLGKIVMQDRHCIMHTFLGHVDSEMNLVLQPEEVVDAKWVNEQELEQMKDEIVETVWDRYLRFKMNII